MVNEGSTADSDGSELLLKNSDEVSFSLTNDSKISAFAYSGISFAQLSGGGNLDLQTGGGGSVLARVRIYDDVIKLEGGDWASPAAGRARITLSGNSAGSQNGDIIMAGGGLGTPAAGESFNR